MGKRMFKGVFGLRKRRLLVDKLRCLQMSKQPLQVLFGLVYYLAPNKEQRSWKWLTAGSLVGSLMWLALSGLFALYTSFSSSYDRTYGSLAGGIVLLLWLNYSAWAILFGAELNAELDRQADIHAAGGPQAGLTEPAKRVR